jgi:CDP-diglyceride synthetase
MLLVLQTLYLFAPLLVSAALSAVVLRWELLPRLKRPIDGGATLGGRRIFGDSKTWRGVAVAVAGCIATVAVQKYVVGDAAGPVAVVDYERIDAIPFGSAIGAGAMLGELPNSFVKRRVGIAPGKTTKGPSRALFYVWDQIDLLMITWPLLGIWFWPPIGLVITSFVVALVVHPLVALVGYLVGARKSAR